MGDLTVYSCLAFDQRVVDIFNKVFGGSVWGSDVRDSEGGREAWRPAPREPLVVKNKVGRSNCKEDVFSTIDC